MRNTAKLMTVLVALSAHSAFKPLASAVVLEKGDNWAPLALVDGKLVVRGQKELKVLQVSQ